MAKQNKSGGGARKLGHNKKKPCNVAYKVEMRWLKNALLRIKRHCRHFPDDLQAIRTRDRLVEA